MKQTVFKPNAKRSAGTIARVGSDATEHSGCEVNALIGSDVETFRAAVRGLPQGHTRLSFWICGRARTRIFARRNALRVHGNVHKNICGCAGKAGAAPLAQHHLSHQSPVGAIEPIVLFSFSFYSVPSSIRFGAHDLVNFGLVIGAAQSAQHLQGLKTAQSAAKASAGMAQHQSPQRKDTADDDEATTFAIDARHTRDALMFVQNILTYDEDERKAGLADVLQRFRHLTAVNEDALLASAFPTIVRLSREAPFGDIRDTFSAIAEMLVHRNAELYMDTILAPTLDRGASLFIHPDDVVPVEGNKV